MPIRRSRKEDPPAPSRRRVIKVPVEMDQEIEQEAAARGLSYQAAVRLAIAQLLETWKGTGSP